MCLRQDKGGKLLLSIENCEERLCNSRNTALNNYSKAFAALYNTSADVAVGCMKSEDILCHG